MQKSNHWLFLASILLNLIAQGLIAKEPPSLIDLTVIGSPDTPGFEPPQLSFNTAQEYVLVITNDKPYSVVFYFEKFGQEVSTYLLQGTPNVNQDSITLMPTSKVTWHFIPQKEGQFKFYASIPGANQRGKMGEISIKNLPTDAANYTHSQQWVLAKTPLEAEKLPEKKTLFSFLKKTNDL